MKIAFQALVVLLLVWCTEARSQSAWRDQNGKPLPESDSQKSEQGFSAKLLVTSDADWRQKWDTPPDTQPNFTQASEVSNGGRLFVLTFFSNPQVGEKWEDRCPLRYDTAPSRWIAFGRSG